MTVQRTSNRAPTRMKSCSACGKLRGHFDYGFICLSGHRLGLSPEGRFATMSMPHSTKANPVIKGGKMMTLIIGFQVVAVVAGLAAVVSGVIGVMFFRSKFKNPSSLDRSTIVRSSWYRAMLYSLGMIFFFGFTAKLLEAEQRGSVSTLGIVALVCQATAFAVICIALFFSKGTRAGGEGNKN